jgi:hypothetical protein
LGDFLSITGTLIRAIGGACRVDNKGRIVCQQRNNDVPLFQISIDKKIQLIGSVAVHADASLFRHRFEFFRHCFPLLRRTKRSRKTLVLEIITAIKTPAIGRLHDSMRLA